MRKIALVNQKGGCGKTTTAINLACCLGSRGRRVLLLDLDPQGHAGLGLGVRPDQLQETTYEVLLGEIPITKAIQSLRENIDAVFSNVVLSAFDQVMAGIEGREYKLKQCLNDIENGYDYLILDSPPNIGLLTFNGLVACEEAIIPVDSCSFSIHGLGKLIETIRIIEQKVGKVSIRILATNIDLRTRFSRHVVETLRAYDPTKCFQTVIRTCTRLREAASQGKPIIEYDKHCAAFHDYENLTEEIFSQEAEMQMGVLRSEFDLEARDQVRKQTEREIIFTLEAPINVSVKIAGDFNNWMPQALHLTNFPDRPMWQRVISLKPGSYRYKYLVDGQWVTDPRSDATVDDAYGGANSVIHV